MIEQLTIQSFKSLEDVTVDLGQVNVFVGANGSGKSNLLEALGVLSAASDGRVDDQSLLYRGVRPGVPSLYKSAFPSKGRGSTHIVLDVQGGETQYRVSLHNPLKDPKPAWQFKHELWQHGDDKLVGRSPRSKEKPDPDGGLAALKAVEFGKDNPAVRFLKALQGYVIFAPTTPVLRGIASETQPRTPVGLSGGQLPMAVKELMRSVRDNAHADRVLSELFPLIGWAKTFGSTPASSMPLSPAAAASPLVVRFRDRYMREGRNMLSGYDASEGALYILFLAVLAGHEAAPTICAVDNADHALNPRLVRSLMTSLCGWYLDAPKPRQILLTTHNPLVLDGLRLQDDRVRLFTVARSNKGKTNVRRVEIDESMLEKAKEGWTLSRLWIMGELGGLGDV